MPTMSYHSAYILGQNQSDLTSFIIYTHTHTHLIVEGVYFNKIYYIEQNDGKLKIVHGNYVM